MGKAGISEAAKALSALGASKGGKARAEKLSVEERAKVASTAARARWGTPAATATHTGALHIADQTIECAVLEDGRRVLTQETFLEAIGRSRKGKGGQVASSPDGLPPFLAAETLKPFVTPELRKATEPIVFKQANGGRAFGYEATLLPMVCEVYLRARDDGATTRQQLHIVKACDILLRGLAKVGIIALVDEATGYQYDRSRRALEEILDAFIKDELGKWMKRFPDDFYRELFRLKGLQYVPFPSKRPRYVGLWTQDLVYRRLAPGILDDLKRKNPPDARGRRRHKHHQWLTDDIGHPRLQEHIASVVTLMKACDDWETFEKMLNRALPKYKEMPLFDEIEKQERKSLMPPENQN